MGLSFLKNAASTLTRLIRRLTASSSRSMSWPNTSTRPVSRVRSPLMRRMRVDLPEPLAPRIPWMSPRSRRSDTSVIAATGLRFRPTTNDLLTPSMSRAGTADVTVEDAGTATGVVVFSWLVRVAVTSWLLGSWRGGVASGGKDRAAGLVRRLSGGLAARGVRSWFLLGGRGKGIKKAGGLIWPTARVLSGRRSCRLRLARDGHRSPAIRSADRRRGASEIQQHLHSETASKL